MAKSTRILTFALLGALLGATASFVMTTVAMDTAADTVVVGVSATVAFLLVLLAQGADGVAELSRADRGALGLSAMGGALAWWAAPLLVLSQRATDAPSGADTLFMSSAAWGLACVAGSMAVASERRSVTALAGAIASVAGSAGLLASWESPSSFSPFAKFPMRESLMLLAGVLFAVGTLALVRAGGKAGVRVVLAGGLGGAAAVGLLVAVPGLPAPSELASGALLPCLYVGVAVAVFAGGWVYSCSMAGVARASTALLTVPLAVMSLSVVEGVTTVYGPNPIAWAGAFAGAAVCMTGAVVTWLSDRPASEVRASSKAAIAPVVLAAAALLLAIASLLTPSLDAVASGGISAPFSAAWVMLGYESAAGWLAVGAGALALAAAWTARAGGSRRAWVLAAVGSVVCALASWPLLGTTLHTWNNWVPAEVQQTYGTEYSRLEIAAHLDPVRVTALVLAVVAMMVLAYTSRPHGIGNRAVEEGQS